MKTVWVKAMPWNKDLVTTALEAGADAVMVEAGRKAEVEKLGRIRVIAPDGDLKPDVDFSELEIRGAADEDKIVAAARRHPVIVHTSDWTVIPLENLVARADNIMVAAAEEAEARTALGILEKGVSGILVTASAPAKARKIILLAKESSENLALSILTVTRIQALGMGDRVCVDTCSAMGPGEGLLVGNSSAALFLIHAETLENPYVEPRPFRVNAGPLHAYVCAPGGRTRYLSELKAGDPVVVVGHQGRTSEAVVGRIKMEKRPLMLVEAEHEGEIHSTIVQNAETIRLVTPEGGAVSVVELKPGDKVMGRLEAAGRHFGHRVTETIIEK